jgi:hypothetical protein
MNRALRSWLGAVLAGALLTACGDEPAPGTGPADPGPALYVDARANLPAAASMFTMDVGLGDFDGDGDIDALLAVEFGQNRLLLNDGSARFVDGTEGRLPVAAHDSEDIAVADFDADGDLDVIVVSEDDRTNEFYVNDGNGSFSAGALPATGTSNGVVVGDIDDDGDIDVIVGNAGPEFVWMNDGTGHWTDESGARIPVTSVGVTQDLELGDVDGDGDLDLLVGNEDGNRMLLNDGLGFFTDVTDSWIPDRPGLEETREVDLGDVDGDGDLDAYFANTAASHPSADRTNRLLLNEGDRFVDVTGERIPAVADRSFDGEFWDVDGDGDLDIVSGALNVSDGQAVLTRFRVLVNDGAGVFTDPTEPIFPSSAAGAGFDSEMADLDGDGDGDFILASRGTQDLLMLRR